MATTIPASPAKLRNGTWGARVQSSNVRAGDTLAITTRSGKSWDALVERVVWSGDGVSICATRSLDIPAPRRHVRRSQWCDCGACEDLLSFGYRPGQRIKCQECGGLAEAC